MANNEICGAKTRSGNPCQLSPMQNGRCRLHGGLSTGAPKGNKNALKHGLYSRVYTDEQLDTAKALQGDVSHELAIARLQLAQVLGYQQSQGDTPEIYEIKDETLATDDDESVAKSAKAKEAQRCGEYYDPDEDDWTGQESEPLKRTRVYRRRDWSVEQNRLINLIAKLEYQLVKQQMDKLELEQRKKELEAQSVNRAKDVSEMTDAELDRHISKLLGGHD